MLDNPAAYDIMNKLCAAWRKECVPVAQLDRVSDSDSEGRWFESSRAYQNVLMKDATPKTPHESAAFSHIIRRF